MSGVVFHLFIYNAACKKVMRKSCVYKVNNFVRFTINCLEKKKEVNVLFIISALFGYMFLVNHLHNCV